MTTMHLNRQKIHDICHSTEGQQEVYAFVNTMNTQGVTQMFIDFKKVEILAKEIVINDFIGGAPPGFKASDFSESILEEKLVKFLTDKIEGYLCRIPTLGNMDESHGFPMFKEFMEHYLTHPMKPITFFFWMSQFAVLYRQIFENIVAFCHANSILLCPTRKYREFMKKIENAVPLGVSAQATSLSWIYENEKNFAEIDFSEILSAIPFDRYYTELFEENPNTQEFMNPEFPNLGFVCKDEIHRLTDEAFKPMILDYVFADTQSRTVENINNGIKKLFAEKTFFVYQQYSRAIFTVKASEFARIQKELIAFFNKHDIPYQLVSNEPIDPMMFTSTPEGSIPS